MPHQPIGLNLARIVHRLMTSHRGWRVSQIRDELNIAERTYRKYRQMLQEEFAPWRRMDGTSALLEVIDGDERYLRLRPPRSIGATDPDLETMAAAVYLARSLLVSLRSAPFRRAAELLVADFHTSLRDRDFLMGSLLDDAQGRFVVEGLTLDARDDVVGNLLRAMTNRRFVTLVISGELRKGAPVSLVVRPTAVVCTLRMIDGEDEVDLSQIEQTIIERETFD